MRGIFIVLLEKDVAPSLVWPTGLKRSPFVIFSKYSGS